MKNIIILIPLYNDWKSLNILLQKIEKKFKTKYSIEVLVVNDCSTEKCTLSKFKIIKKINILNLKQNVGSQKAIFLGLNHILKNRNKNIIIIMDADGEDDYSKINILIEKAEKNFKKIVFAKRTRRLEPFFLKILNQVRLIITYLLTGKYLDIGNFSAFHSNNLKNFVKKKNLSLAYCSGMFKNFDKISFVGLEKRKRFCDISRVNSVFLIKHSINIISVFYKEVFLRSLILSFLINFIFFQDAINYYIISMILILNIFLFANYLLNERVDLKKIIKSVTRLK